jgi:hypothetical protein
MKALEVILDVAIIALDIGIIYLLYRIRKGGD